MIKLNSDARMAVIETEVKNINKSIDKHISDQRKDFDTVFKKLDKMGNQFAGKWVEKVSIGVLISIIAGIVIFIINRGGI